MAYEFMNAYLNIKLCDWISKFNFDCCFNVAVYTTLYDNRLQNSNIKCFKV